MSAARQATVRRWLSCFAGRHSGAGRRLPRGTLAFALMIGHHFMAADHSAHSHADALELAARWLLA